MLNSYELASQLLQFRFLGGKGSGNFHHKGRPGEVGGSASWFSSEGQAAKSSDFKTRLAKAKDTPHPGEIIEIEHRWIPKNQYNEAAEKKAGWHFSGLTDEKGNFTASTHVQVGRNRYEPLTKQPWTSDKQIVEAISEYTFRDKAPTGTLGALLEKGISQSEGLNKDVVSYRGMRLNKETFASLKEGEVLSFGRPASFTSSDAFAWDFASSAKTGYRTSRGEIGVLFQTLVPKGTKALFTGAAKGAASIAGNEHLLSGKTKYVIRSVAKFRSGYRVLAEVVE